jgi:hypothetical protein
MRENVRIDIAGINVNFDIVCIMSSKMRASSDLSQNIMGENFRIDIARINVNFDIVCIIS